MRRISLVFIIMIVLLACQTTTYGFTRFTAFALKNDLPVAVEDKDETIIDHKFIKISYDQSHLLANYVQYTLTRANLMKDLAERPPTFTPDPALVDNDLPFLNQNDIKLSRDGYIRGHLAPSADFKFSEEAREVANYMSNITPQDELLNDQGWKKLEDQVRKWGCGEGRLVVITGPILSKKPKKLQSGVSVPKAYFKAIADMTPPLKTIAFVYSQGDANALPEQRVITVKELDETIGYDLFPYLDESNIDNADIESWKSEKCFN